MKVLIIDDDRSLVDALGIGLQIEWSNIEVLSAPDGARGVQLFAAEAPNLTLLDVSMPIMNGWEALKQMRQLSDAPIIMLTAHGEEMDKIRGLTLGADDFISKPFGHNELFARMKAVLRRTESRSPATARPSFVSGELAVNFDTREVIVAGSKVKLTPKEYKLLYLLVRNAGYIVPFEIMLGRIWGDEYRDCLGYLKTYISRLRSKLGDDGQARTYIVTERGVGYRFVRPQAAKA
jgi:DNA-binding response OmpR family regulator